MRTDKAETLPQTYWQLVREKDVIYYRAKWKDTVVIYSTKHGEDGFLRKFKPVFLKQIHSETIIDIDFNSERVGDGIVTRRKNRVLGIKVADCLPVYLFNPDKICIIHCGWRSIIKGIAQQANTIMDEYKYILGASIGVCCYEIKEDLMKLFKERYKRAVIYNNHRYFLDIKAAVVEDLGEKNLVASLDLCTKCHADYFYSHRRGDKKRNYALITSCT